MPSSEAQPDSYSSWVGLIYVFNLIVGTGALTLPSVFAKAGWAVSTILIIALCFISYVTVTFVVETMACANAIIHLKRDTDFAYDSESEEEETTEETAIMSVNRNLRRLYSLNQKVELGQMAGLFFNKTGRILFFISLCVYLYGDLAIYAAAISKSVCDVVCPHNHTDFNSTSNEFELNCFNESISKLALYRILVGIFAFLVGPFSYFNVQKTKYFQLATTSMRWCAFLIMITLATIRICKFGQLGFPLALNCDGIPVLIGASVYSFMCHHSLPGLISPFNSKNRVLRQLALDYILICSFYLVLALTGVFAFKDLYDLYTLNFMPTQDEENSYMMELIQYFLGLFPVFTLSTSFPIIAITLQNNLKSIFLDQNRMENYGFVLKRLTFPTLAVIPPILVALSVHNVGSLVEFTGSYAGTCIQYVIPALLVYQARKHCKRDIGEGIKNKYASPFKSMFWINFVICWSLVCVILVSVNLFS